MILLLMPLLLSSCFTIRAGGNAGNRMPDRKPFVSLLNGKRLEPVSVCEKPDSIIAGSQTVAKKDVFLYSDGKATFANICDPCGNPFEYKFAPAVVQGKLNIYRATWVSAAKPGQHAKGFRSKDYIQKSDTGALREYRYGAISRMILPGDPGYQYLVKYRHRTVYGTLGFIGSIGVIVAGVGILTSSHHSLVQAAGDITIISGSLGYFASIFSMSGIRDRFMNKAVAAYNE